MNKKKIINSWDSFDITVSQMRSLSFDEAVKKYTCKLGFKLLANSRRRNNKACRNANYDCRHCTYTYNVSLQIQSSAIWLVSRLAEGRTFTKSQIAAFLRIKESSVYGLLRRARNYLRHRSRKLQLIYDAESKVYRIYVPSKNYNIKLENLQSYDDNVTQHHMTVLKVRSLEKKRKMAFLVLCIAWTRVMLVISIWCVIAKVLSGRGHSKQGI